MKRMPNFSVERMAGPVWLWQFESSSRASHRSPRRWVSLKEKLENEYGIQV
jgi:hypothetical protein